MEIVDYNAGLVTNFEVLEHLNSTLKTDFSQHSKDLERLKASVAKDTGKRRAENQAKLTLFESRSEAIWLRTLVRDYLKAQPCAIQSSDKIAGFIEANESWMQKSGLRLVNTELLQLINHRPTQLVEVHRIVEECEERFTEADTLQLLDSIAEHLGKPVTEMTNDAMTDDAQ